MTTATTKSRGPYARTAKRRQVIARAVLDIVQEKGHGNVTTAEVAGRAGASEATVLYHYPTKDHLLVAALQCADDAAGEQLSAAEVVLDLERLRVFARGTPREENIMRLYASLAGSAMTPGHPAQEYFTHHYRATVEQWARFVGQRQASGLAHPGLDAVEVARQVIATWEGLQAQWLLDPAFDLGDVLVAAFRRLTAQNWMEARRLMLDPNTGI